MIKSINSPAKKTSEQIIEEKYSKKFINSVKLINLIFPHIIKLPYGFHECNECKINGHLQISYKPNKFQGNKRLRIHISRTEGKSFSVLTCKKCGSSGFIDWATNAMSSDKKNKQYLASVPFYALSDNKVHNASSIFYSLYFDDRLSGFDHSFINFNKPPKRLKNKQAIEFINFFELYKKEREKRKKFLKINFNEIKKTVFDIQVAKLKEMRSGSVKNSNIHFFDIFNWEIDDTIKIQFTGKFARTTHQFSKRLEAKERYLLDVKNPDYSNVKKMADAIFNSTELYTRT
jgi:hypothetical protein